jgi:hypothetical protein
MVAKNVQAETAVRLLEEAIDKLCDQLPTEVDEEVAAKIEETVARIKENREQRKVQAIPEGKYFANPLARSTYLKDLRELLVIFKKVVIPMKVKEELAKLKAVAVMVDQAKHVNQEELHQEIQKANVAGKNQIDALNDMAQILKNLAQNG